jgi:hypothetical protein
LAYSGEWGAIRAYLGHRASLPFGEGRTAIRQILADEIRHRRTVLRMLGGLGGRPDRVAERKLTCVGGAIAAFCRVGGWFLPMYGAARLEADNIVEYEILARLAWWAGERHLIPELLHLAEVEWDHEARLRAFAASHRGWRWMPHWPLPARREEIRVRFDAFTRAPTEVRRRWSLLVR